MITIEHQYTALEQVIANQALEKALDKLLHDYNKHRVFIFASNTISTKTDVVADLIHSLGERFVGLFDSVRAHTPRDDVMAGLKSARAAKADVLLAIGGGSIIDAAKAVQLALNLDIKNEQALLDCAQFSDGSRGSKAKDIVSGLITVPSFVRMIAVPTTLSGAEFSNTAGVLDTHSNSKEGYRAPNLYPQAIIYDPSITVHTPEWLWLSTAIRSVDHAVEGFCSAKSYPFLDGQFLHALQLFSTSLRQVKKEPRDLNARGINQQAVWLACCGLGKVSHGASHGIGYVLGSLCGVPHGYTSCVMLAAVLEWNYSINAEGDAAIAKALGCEGQTASAAVKQLIADLGLPTCLRDVNVEKEKFEHIAERSFNNSVVQLNPRAIQSADDVLEILDLAAN